MRIIGGAHGGRMLRPPMKKWPTRPTTDIAKEALFNILTNKLDFDGLAVLDLFGGTGGIAIEFASRGAAQVTFVDSYYGCVSWIKEVTDLLKMDNISAIKSDVKRYIKTDKAVYDIIFADPPYALQWLRDLPDLILEMSGISEETLIIIEHGADISFSGHAAFKEQRKYGQSIFSFFVRQPSSI